MELPLISADNMFGLMFAFLGLAAFGFWSERTRLGQWLSGVVLTILAGTLLANLRVVPFASPFHDMVWTYAVSLAIPLLLFHADIRKLISEAGMMIAAFAVAVAGTVAGVLAGFYLIDLGPDANRIAATLGASWIGGSMNFAAVAQALGLNENGALIATMAATDAVVMVVFMAAILTMAGSRALLRFIPSKIIEAGDDGVAHKEEAKPPLDMGALATLLFLAAACAFGGRLIGEMLGMPGYSVLFITLIALALANLFPAYLAKLRGGFDLGMFFMYVFFGVIGAGADVVLMVQTAMPIFFFVLVMATVHLAVVLAGAKIFRIDLAEALIASNAVAVGPATAAAMAASQRWRLLVTPGVLLGVFGYAIANFIGVGLAGFLG
ncbi:MAG: DUF819 family protein [Parvibaculum sp.]|uniref:DUF819 family protein n=1 Tax=Parvibaculum sp. TaxID=2024848 RepID=UPI001DE58BCF|nr:DUF819 family protein [Parvibaculum sp.]MBX3490396.1 DUF819 family protein [Parvibaculum sp.]MBX3495308.1 DUF819 family protein [Parvibaculum sp.]MCW5728253.1 DUF819 family protein [Parvibaculum sp.]